MVIKHLQHVSSDAFAYIRPPLRAEADILVSSNAPKPLKPNNLQVTDLVAGFSDGMLRKQLKKTRRIRPTHRFRHRQLQVVVMPHSHDDVGWRRTVQQYYDETVDGILDQAVRFLPRHRDMRFVEVEMAFMELWWSRQNETVRATWKE